MFFVKIKPFEHLAAGNIPLKLLQSGEIICYFNKDLREIKSYILSGKIYTLRIDFLVRDAEIVVLDSGEIYKSRGPVSLNLNELLNWHSCPFPEEVSYLSDADNQIKAKCACSGFNLLNFGHDNGCKLKKVA